MALGEQFCLQLNDFENNIKTAWRESQNNKDFCDVTLACDDKQIAVHKLVISTSSPVLKNILSLNSNQNSFIYLKGVKYRELINLVNFMYQGEVNIAQEELNSFLSVAEDLKIKGLSGNNGNPFVENPQNNENPFVENFKNNETPFVENPQNYENSFVKKSPKNGNPFFEKKKSLIGCNYTLADAYKKGHIETKAEPLFTNGQTIEQQVEYEEEKQVEYEDTENNPIENYNIQEKPQPMQSIVSIEEGTGSNSCRVCGKLFANKRTLLVHTDAKHKGIRYSCEKCEYKATTKDNLKKHDMSVHEGITYPCSICDYKAKQKQKLKSHNEKYH